MTTERIDIVVSERGSRTVRRNIDDVGKSASGAQGAVQLLRRALGALAGVAALRTLVGLVDTFTNLQNRLRIVTTGTAQLGVVTERLFGIANRTRSSFEATTEVFARTALALKDLGISQQATLEFTESLNQAVILSGASAQEAQAGLIQLSQGLASGTLRGDELRSVLEQLPAVSDVIAKSLGITRGELRNLGQEGKITAGIILKAFQESRQELAERFAKTLPTIGQAFTVLRNNVVRFVGELSTTSGVSEIAARAIISLADNVDILGRAFGAAAITIGTIFAARAVRSAITALRLLAIAVATNPLGALLLAITAVISALITFGDQLKLTAEGAANVGDFLAVAFDEASSAIVALGDIALPVFNDIIGFAEGIVGPINLSFTSIVQFAARAVDTLVGFWKGAFLAIVASFDRLPAALGDVFFLALKGVTEIVQDALNTLIQSVNKVTEFFGFGSIGEVTLNVNNPFAGEARAAGAAAGQAFQEGFQSVNFASEAVQRVLEGAEQRAQERLKRQEEERASAARAEADLGRAGVDKTAGQQTQKLKDLIRDLQREGELLQLSNEERALRETLFKAEDAAARKLTTTEQTQIENLVKQNQELQAQRTLLDDIEGPRKTYEDGLKALNSLLDRGAISTDEFRNKMRELRIELLESQTDALSGFERGLLKVEQEFTNVADIADNAVVNAFRNAEDALVEFVQTGKLSFSDLVKSIQADLTRLAVRQAVTGPLASLLGGSAGGGAGLIGSLFPSGGAGLGSLLGFKEGGQFTVGGGGGVDSQIVAFKATPGENVSVQPKGSQAQMGGGGRPVVMNFNFPPGTDVESFRRNRENIAASLSRVVSRANQRNN